MTTKLGWYATRRERRAARIRVVAYAIAELLMLPALLVAAYLVVVFVAAATDRL